MSRNQRAAARKNTRRIDAVINDTLTLVTYGKVTRALGNKMFNVLSVKKRNHLAHIRGKMMRIEVNDVVLLNIRDYETRADTDNAVYDIVAVFPPKDIQNLMKAKKIPKWFLQDNDMDDNEHTDDLYDLFDYEQGTDDVDFGKNDDMFPKYKKPITDDDLNDL